MQGRRSILTTPAVPPGGRQKRLAKRPNRIRVKKCLSPRSEIGGRNCFSFVGRVGSPALCRVGRRFGRPASSCDLCFVRRPTRRFPHVPNGELVGLEARPPYVFGTTLTKSSPNSTIVVTLKLFS